MNKILIAIIIVILLIAGGWFLVRRGGSPSSSTGSVNNLNLEPNSQNNGIPVNTGSKEFMIVGRNFSFSPSAITAQKGDKVKITFKDSDGFHDLKIDGYNVATQRVKTGEEGVVEFIADKTGVFEFYCSVGSHRENGMKGILVVK